MKLRYGWLYFLFLPLAGTFAQRADTVLLKTVTVFGLPEEKYLTGSVMRSLDSTTQMHNVSQHLGDVLALQVPVYFRNYGSGMISGITLRGTAPQHTSVLWNGLSINSFSLGQADFSILPTIAFSDVKVHEGGGSARYGSGAFGGTVLLTSAGNNTTPLMFIQEMGSFGRYFTALKGHITSNQWSFSTNAYRVQAKNNFPVKQTGERQDHAAYHQEGIVEDITYRWSSSRTVSLHYWYHQADRDIQPTIDQHNSKDEQQDRNHRLQLVYEQHHSHGLIKASAGITDDVIVYNHSKSEVLRYTAGASHQYTFGNGLHIHTGGEWNHIIGKIPNYENGKAAENRGDVFASFQKDIGRRLSMALNLRQPFVEGFNAPFLPYLGQEFMLIRTNTNVLSIRSSISRNYRVPTLNDRYWQDAGSQTLLPEKSYAAEAGMSWHHEHVKTDLTFFTQKVDNWIQWIPQAGGDYEPRNLKQVVAKGIELTVEEMIPFHEEVSLSIRASGQLTHSVTTEAPPTEEQTIGKQLIYTPRYTANGRITFLYHQWSVATTAQYSGKRYGDASNAEEYALKGFVLADCVVSRYMLLNRHRFDMSVSVRNIFNTNYQLLAGRALPQRNFNIQLIYQLKPINTP